MKTSTLRLLLLKPKPLPDASRGPKRHLLHITCGPSTTHLGAAQQRIGPSLRKGNSTTGYTSLLNFSHCSSSTSHRSSDITSLHCNWGGDEYGLRWISSTCVEVLLLLLPSAVLALTVDGKANPCCLLSTVL